MNKPLHLIYVTGLGDSNPRGQRLAIKTWRWWGVESELFQMNWADGEAWPLKFDRLLKKVEALKAAGKDVGLVGVSAGAGAAINVFAARKSQIIGCVLIAGKVNRPASIGDNYRRKNPAFVSSAQDVQVALSHLDNGDRDRILSRYAVADELVSKADSRIPGTHNRLVPSVGHFFTIATQITLGAPSFIHFLKRQPRLA